MLQHFSEDRSYRLYPNVAGLFVPGANRRESNPAAAEASHVFPYTRGQMTAEGTAAAVGDEQIVDSK